MACPTACPTACPMACPTACPTGCPMACPTACPTGCPAGPPILTQPPPAPPSYQTLPHEWGSGLCDCWLGDGIGLWGTACPCLLGARLARAAGESGVLAWLPGGVGGLRTLLRQQLRIRGCVLGDWAAGCCCCPCAVCQMARELRLGC